MKRLNETQVRREFIDPLFDELGWDMANVGGANERDKDVVHEYSLQDPSGHMAPDYSFQIAGERVFFVEAKRPAVDVSTALSPAFQLRSYAWSAQLPLSVLTDFKHLAIYDCREVPNKLNNASYARVFYWEYTAFVDKWDEIAAILSKRAVSAGSLDAWTKGSRPPKGSMPPDVAFLKLIETWREELAKSFSKKNAGLNAEDLNTVVQTTIDRILFLRIAEDRGLEPYKQLLGAKPLDTYSTLSAIFRQADAKYNSGLFHFSKEPGRTDPDNLSLSLKVDNGVLRDIISDLYFPNSPYQFAIMPVELLGQVYERFLGNVISINPGTRTTEVIEKPEVRKAGGIYYTPEYIVDYMVEATLGAVLRDKTVAQVARLKIIDPACGSGTFLIRCYQFLLDWHLDQYKLDPERYKSRIRNQFKGGVVLTADERKKILLRSIYGVDKDEQAVETTKLSLLLKVLEGETAQSLNRELTFLKRRALPDLDKNIKCGNSIIGPDYFAGRDLKDVSDEELKAIRPFDWDKDFLKELKASGFDVVIGNPPYIFTREQIPSYEREYYASTFSTSFDKHNTFALFMELMTRLLSKNGRGSYIVPNSWLTIASLGKLRELMIPRLDFITDINYAVFNKVNMEPCIFGIAGQALRGDVHVSRVYSRHDLESETFDVVSRSAWSTFGGSGSRITFQHGGDEVALLDRLVGSCSSVGEVFDVRTGAQAYEKGKGKPPQTAADVKNHVFDRRKKVDRFSVRYLEGADVRRYFTTWSGMWMQYGPWLSQPRTINVFTRPRVLIREITNKFPHCLNACYIEEQYLNNKSVLNVLHQDDDIESLRALCAVLNSRLMSLYYKERAVKSARKLFPKIVINNLREYPYPQQLNTGLKTQLSNAASEMGRIAVALSNPANGMAGSARAAMKRRGDLLERQIDELVYRAFDLSPVEIKIVDAAEYS